MTPSHEAKAHAKAKTKVETKVEVKAKVEAKAEAMSAADLMRSLQPRTAGEGGDSYGHGGATEALSLVACLEAMAGMGMHTSPRDGAGADSTSAAGKAAATAAGGGGGGGAAGGGAAAATGGSGGGGGVGGSAIRIPVGLSVEVVAKVLEDLIHHPFQIFLRTFLMTLVEVVPLEGLAIEEMT